MIDTFVVPRAGLEEIRKMLVEISIGRVQESHMMMRVHVYTVVATCILVVLCMYFPTNDDHRVPAIALWAMGAVSVAYAATARWLYKREVKRAVEWTNEDFDRRIYEAQVNSEIELLTRTEGG